jgi:hypothetical protein
MSTSIEGGPSVKMDCVSPKRRRRRSGKDPEGLADQVRDRIAGLLPEEALEDAVRGLRPEELSGQFRKYVDGFVGHAAS